MQSVDYILFLTADVTVTPNLNEIRDFKYVSKEELQAMFEDPGMFPELQGANHYGVPDDIVAANSFTPWFKLICETMLFEWWSNLNSGLEKYLGETEIRRM